MISMSAEAARHAEVEPCSHHEAARHAEVERRKAAIFIQKMWRGHCLRGVHIRLREASRQMSAVRAPPSNARFTSDAEYYTQMYGRPYPPHVKKAIYIQKMWRGWIGRRDANREWWAQQTLTIGELAAITIQKIWRGHLGRKAACWKDKIV